MWSLLSELNSPLPAESLCYVASAASRWQPSEQFHRDALARIVRDAVSNSDLRTDELCWVIQALESLADVFVGEGPFWSSMVNVLRSKPTTSSSEGELRAALSRIAAHWGSQLSLQAS
jgi:hypothetical protein